MDSSVLSPVDGRQTDEPPPTGDSAPGGGYAFHPLADIFPMLEAPELQALADDIAENGQHEPVVLYQGAILDGRNRYAACVAAGVPCEFTTYTGDNALAYVVSLNLRRRHLDESQRGMVARRISTVRFGDNQHTMGGSIDPPITQSVAAEMLNVSVPTVKRAGVVIDQGVPELIQAVDRGDIAVSAAAAIARQPEETQREILATQPHVSHNSGNNEWYTPAEYIAAARATMGGIDLDPASSPEANAVIGADVIYTSEDDGLARDWTGRVWLNPPYASDLVGRFAARMAESYDAGAVTTACVLVNNATETAWFGKLVASASAVCFPRGRVRFWEPGGRSGAPLQGQAVIYMGDDADAFCEAFGSFGWVARIWA